MGTWILVVQTPCLNEILSQLGVSQQVHVTREQLHIVSGKLLQLQVHPTHLTILRITSSFQFYFSSFPNIYFIIYLCVKRIIVQKISAMECLAVGLVEGNNVLLPSEYLNLKYILNLFVQILHF